MSPLPTALPDLLTLRRRTRARLRRVQRALGVYEELACAAALRPALRPAVPRRPVRSRPGLQDRERRLRESLRQLDAALVGSADAAAAQARPRRASGSTS